MKVSVGQIVYSQVKTSNLPADWKEANPTLGAEYWVKGTVVRRTAPKSRSWIVRWDVGYRETCVSSQQITNHPPMNVIQLPDIADLAPDPVLLAAVQPLLSHVAALHNSSQQELNLLEEKEETDNLGPVAHADNVDAPDVDDSKLSEVNNQEIVDCSGYMWLVHNVGDEITLPNAPLPRAAVLNWEHLVRNLHYIGLAPLYIPQNPTTRRPIDYYLLMFPLSI